MPKTIPGAPHRTHSSQQRSSAVQDIDNLIYTIGLTEASLELVEGKDENGQEKREIVLTCLQEGPGNPTDKRFYSRACVEGLDGLIGKRKKLFVDHLAEGAPPASDSLRNWAGTIIKSWLVENEGVLQRKVRVKIHEDWLWRRCKDAPQEIALSIEGRGAGRTEKKDGQDVVLIEKIYWLNAFKFVSYPGNAAMGADLVEGAPATVSTTEEEHPMDLSKLTLQMLRESRPELIEAIATEAAAKVKADEAAKGGRGDFDARLNALREELRGEFDTRVKAQAETITALKTQLEESHKKLDASEVRERLARKEVVIDRLLKESGLSAEVITPLFMANLRSVVEREVPTDGGGKKVLTVEEQIKAEIDERKKICTPHLARVTESGAAGAPAGGGEALTEDEKQFLFEKTILKTHGDLSLTEYRKQRDAGKTQKEAAPAK